MHTRVEHRDLWNELVDFEAGDWDKALEHLLSRMAEVVPVSNAAWLGAVRTADEPATQADGLHGWQPRAMQLLGANGTLLRPRRCRRTSVKSAAAVPHASQVHSHFDAYVPSGTRVSLYIFMPVTERAASMIGLFRDAELPAFTAAEHELVHDAQRGLKWFHRQVLLCNGLLLASSPFTLAERRVLRELLRGGSEKIIAANLGLGYHSTHEHVANIYKKFAINTRAELMALWLGKRPDSSA